MSALEDHLNSLWRRLDSLLEHYEGRLSDPELSKQEKDDIIVFLTRVDGMLGHLQQTLEKVAVQKRKASDKSDQ